MIKLTKLNNEEFVLNCNQIQSIEMIPESKVILMNKEYYVVKESPDEIIKKTIEYDTIIWDKRRMIKMEK